MNKLKTALGILLIFLLGALGGSFITQFYLKDQPRPPKFRTFDAHQQRFLHHLERELDLTPEQSRNIDKILKDTGREMHVFFDSNRAALDRIRQNSMDNIKKQLSDEQQAGFDLIISEMDTRRKRSMEHGHRLPPPEPGEFRHGPHRPGPP